jgi:preprotein translocase subunit SecG
MDGMVFPLVLTIHILVGLTVIGLVLIQHGKGADMGAAFGSGASGSLFGASGSANFLSRTTAVCAAIFFLTSLSLSYMASTRATIGGGSVMDTIKSEAIPSAPPTAQTPASAPVDAGSKAKDIPK